MRCTSGYVSIGCTLNPPDTAEGFDGSHHPMYAEWQLVSVSSPSTKCNTESTELRCFKILSRLFPYSPSLDGLK